MNIGIDARFFGPKAKGLGRYTQELISSLGRQDKKNKYFIFLRKEDFEKVSFEAPNFKKVLADYSPYSLKEQIVFPFKISRQKIDLMHFTHFNAPFFFRGRFVVTVHDLILKKFPTKRPGFFNLIKYKLKDRAYNICLKAAVNRSQKIIAVSNYTKQDIINSLGVEEEKISVIYEGSVFPALPSKKEGIENVLKKYGITPPFVLYVGNAYPHKNLPFLLDAFEYFLGQDKHLNLQLVLVGKRDDFYRQIEKKFHQTCYAFQNKKKRFCTSVMFTGFVPDRHLAVLYQKASFYIFPSLYEGFGFPGLEAMFFDLPVLSSDQSCLPEVFGQAALYFNPRSREDFAMKAKALLQDQFLRQKLISFGRRQIQKFNWHQTAKETLKVYNQAL